MRSRGQGIRAAAGRLPATLALLTALSTLGLLACVEQASGTPPPYAEIRGQRVALEIARSPAEQRRGLGYRDSLAWDHGMLFPYEREDFHAFWMKGMRFDIDIVWIRDERIVDIAHRVPHDPDSNGPTVRPRELADTVLEVPAGYALARGWQPGDRVSLVLDAP